MSQLPADRLEVHEVAEAGPGALSGLVLPAAGLPEVCHGRQLRVDGPATEPTVVEVVDGLLGVILLLELDVHVAHQVVPEVVAHVHLLDLSVFVLALHEDVLEEVVVVVLHLLVRDVGEVGPVRSLGGVLGVNVEVLEDARLGEGGLVVDPGSPYLQRRRES